MQRASQINMYEKKGRPGLRRDLEWYKVGFLDYLTLLECFPVYVFYQLPVYMLICGADW